MKNICPVCGFDGLDFKPYDEKGFGTFEICPCCGFEFGCDDFPDKKASWLKWRKAWITNGCVWFSQSTKPPQNWDAKNQLKIFNNDDINCYKA